MKLRKIAAVLIAIVVLCAAPIGGLVGVSRLKPKRREKHTRSAISSNSALIRRAGSRIRRSFPPSIKSQKTGSAMVITAAQGLVVPWLRATG